MRRVIPESEIRRLLFEKKILPTDFHTKFRAKPKSGFAFRERELEMTGVDGSTFVIWIRENVSWIQDFTIGLRLIDVDGQQYILRRYNGPSHCHTNHLEKLSGHDNARFSFVCHVHTATERYQVAGRSIDGFAEPSTDFSTPATALQLMFVQNQFFTRAEDNPQQPGLFDDSN